MPKPKPPRHPETLAGSPLDWGALLATHERWLRTAIAARLGERQAADEVFQEVALAAVSRSLTLSDSSKAGGWLYRIAVRQTLLFRRKQGRRRRMVHGYAERGGDSCESADDRNPLGWLLLDERRQIVRAALNRLHRRDAEILLLKYTEDWSCKDLAERLGLGAAAVEARLHRARRRLREVLAKSSAIEVSQ